MIKNQIERQQFQNHHYERYQLYSAALNQDFCCGFLRQDTTDKITKTLYLFHGGGADDSQTAQAGLLPVLANLLNGHPEIQVVMPCIGGSFLHDHPTQKNKSYTKYFMEEVIPSCEHGTQTQPDGRYLGGWSMGGQAALNLFLRLPEQFAGAGVHFPTLVDFDYNDTKQTSAYANRGNVSDDMMKILVEEFQKVFVDTKDFNNHNPLHLAKNLTKERLENKRIYFDVGSNDEFGLCEGAQVFHETLTNKGITHHFKTIPDGKHDGPFIHAQISSLIKYLLDLTSPRP